MAPLMLIAMEESFPFANTTAYGVETHLDALPQNHSSLPSSLKTLVVHNIQHDHNT